MAESSKQPPEHSGSGYRWLRDVVLVALLGFTIWLGPGGVASIITDVRSATARPSPTAARSLVPAPTASLTPTAAQSLVPAATIPPTPSPVSPLAPGAILSLTPMAARGSSAGRDHRSHSNNRRASHFNGYFVLSRRFQERRLAGASRPEPSLCD